MKVLEIKYSTRFKKDVKVCQKRHYNMALLPHRECHIQPDWLLIYYQTDTELYLYRTGTHADLFGL